jgi:ribosome biogenesis GTPase
LKTGTVIKSTGSRYKVLLNDNTVLECVIRGKFRKKDLRATNPVAVGDKVTIDDNPAATEAVITEIHPRQNYIIRKSTNLSKESQILAANIDQLILVVTIKHPETPLEFIDRFLATAEAYRIRSVIVVNKTDIYSDDEKAGTDNLIKIYSDIGYECIKISVLKKEGIDAVRKTLAGKVSLVAGNSGVGKSSLLNLINPGLKLKTGEISDYHLQGKHITTFPEMHPLTSGGFVIDSPGLRGFGLTDIDRREVYHFFPEIFRLSEKCRFYNCLHLEEPGCAVREAALQGIVYWSRYRSYLNILEDSNTKYR